MSESLPKLLQSDPWSLPMVAMNQLHKLPKSCGLYFVFKSSQLLYIGMTSSGFRARWAGHHRSDVKNQPDLFVSFLELPSASRDELLRLEALAISMYAPALNNTPVLKHGAKVSTNVREPKNTQRTTKSLKWNNCSDFLDLDADEAIALYELEQIQIALQECEV